VALLETNRLSVSIGGISVCRQLDLQIQAGECWCILGRNGAGKTTLLHTLAGLRPPRAGHITLNAHPLAELPPRTIARQLGILLQDHSDAFPATVLETALTGRHPWLGPWQWEGASDYRKARGALAAVDLGAFENRNTLTLSGGERRRLGIATLLTQDPQLLLLDEPTNHLDIHYQIRTLDLLRDKLQADGKALLLVMHDLNLAVRYCDHFLLLFADGDTAQGSRSAVLVKDNLERLYAHPLTAVPGPRGPVWVPQ